MDHQQFKHIGGSFYSVFSREGFEQAFLHNESAQAHPLDSHFGIIDNPGEAEYPMMVSFNAGQCDGFRYYEFTSLNRGQMWSRISPPASYEETAILHIDTTIYGAQPMTRGQYNAFRGWTPPEGEDQSVEGQLLTFFVGEEKQHTFVLNSRFDNFVTLGHGMTFGIATQVVRRNQPIARAGWNGKGMHVVLVPKNITESGAVVNEHFMIRNVNGSYSSWVPSINDCLADDWYIPTVEQR